MKSDFSAKIQGTPVVLECAVRAPFNDVACPEKVVAYLVDNFTAFKYPICEKC